VNPRAHRDLAGANLPQGGPRVNPQVQYSASVSTHQPSVEGAGAAKPSRSDSLRRLRWLFWGVAVVVGIAAGSLIAVLRSHPAAAPAQTTAPPITAAVTWSAGAKRAPDFSLQDANGKPVSLAAFRGRPVIVTFIDPLCRNLCPLEAKALTSLERSLPARSRPAIVAVSVNQWGNARHVLLQDVAKWKLPSDWHWAVGTPAALHQVWGAYQIAVQDAPKTVAGVTVHNITHTEGAFVVDRHGYQRALYLWPYRAGDVAATLRRLAGTKR
jgi:protein SCO1